MNWLTLVVFLFGIGGILFGIHQHLQAKRVLKRLDEMLEAGLNGTYEEQHYSESLQSSLESKWKQYLDGSSQKSQRQKEEKEQINTLISDISHQTKTPISNILLYGQLLEEQKLPADTKRYIEQIVTQTQKLDFLIRSLIKASRLENGIIALQMKEYRLKQLMDEVLSMCDAFKEKYGVTITSAIEASESCVLVDKKWTCEALYNILENAAKYTDPGDTLELHGVPYELFYRIDITDHGIGINPEESNLIFQRFYRSRRSTEKEGVGLGLYLTRNIITGQGGYLKVASTPGLGSTFSVFLPRLH